MSKAPEISVVMSIHNGGAALEPALDSVLGQDCEQLEFIVVDDGSTDSSWAALQKRSANEPRLVLLQQKHAGLTKALSKGCSAARGEYIARQDVGDLSLPGRLRKQHALLNDHPELAFVACQFVTVGPNGEPLGEPEPADAGKALIESLQTAPPDMRGPHHGCVMFRRSAYEAVGGYRSQFFFAQDLDLWARLIEVGGLAFVDEPLYRVLFAPGSITARHRSRQMILRDLIREAALLRRNGQSEELILQQAGVIRPLHGAGKRRMEADAEYFIGSCLQNRGDPAASKYLRRAIAANPFHLKAWARLISGGKIPRH